MGASAKFSCGHQTAQEQSLHKVKMEVWLIVCDAQQKNTAFAHPVDRQSHVNSLRSRGKNQRSVTI